MKKDFFDELTETFTRTAKEVSEKAEVFYEAQKYQSRMRSELRAGEKAAEKLGRLIYERYCAGEVPDDELIVLCEEIAKHERAARRFEEKAAAVRNSKVCPSCGKTVAPAAAFCQHCGNPFRKEAAAPVEEEDVQAASGEAEEE